MLVPIGSWCRTAFQVKHFVESLDHQQSSYPFDWSITPFSALQKTMGKSFFLQNVLKYENITRNELGSISDNVTDIIHHHDFLMNVIADFSLAGGVNDNGVPPERLLNSLIEDAKGRFSHTFDNLLDAKKSGEKIGFVRWNRMGHPDVDVPDAFKNECLETLTNSVYEFLEHNNFAILMVETVPVDSAINKEDAIKNYNLHTTGVEAIIRERQGFDGTELKISEVIALVGGYYSQSLSLTLKYLFSCSNQANKFDL